MCSSKDVVLAIDVHDPASEDTLPASLRPMDFFVFTDHGLLELKVDIGIVEVVSVVVIVEGGVVEIVRVRRGRDTSAFGAVGGEDTGVGEKEFVGFLAGGDGGGGGGSGGVGALFREGFGDGAGGASGAVVSAGGSGGEETNGGGFDGGEGLGGGVVGDGGGGGVAQHTSFAKHLNGNDGGGVGSLDVFDCDPCCHNFSWIHNWCPCRCAATHRSFFFLLLLDEMIWNLTAMSLDDFVVGSVEDGGGRWGGATHGGGFLLEQFFSKITFPRENSDLEAAEFLLPFGAEAISVGFRETGVFKIHLAHADNRVDDARIEQ